MINPKVKMVDNHLIHIKDLEKYSVDSSGDRLFFYLPITEETYFFIRDIEETFFYPIDEHRKEFNIFIIKEGTIPCLNLSTCKSKDDGTISTVAYLHSLIAMPPIMMLVDIKNSKENQKRIQYMIEKYNIQIQNNPFLHKKQKYRDPISSSLRHEVFKKDNYKCIECGITNKEKPLCIDHIIPKSKGGNDELNNLQTLCFECNLAKSNRNWVGGSNV